MPRRRGMLLSLAVVVAGCGNDTGTPTSNVGPTSTATSQSHSRSADDLPATHPRILRRCAELAASRRLPVLCPSRLPAGRWIIAHQSLRSGTCEYLLDLETRPFGSGDAFHVMAGGRCGPWPLKTRSGRWPARAPLASDLGLVGTRPLKPGQREKDKQYVRLTVLRRVQVAGHNTLLLSAARFPNGGVHGEHIVAIWNQESNGYTLTMHPRPGLHGSTRDGEALALDVADAMARSNTG